MQQVPLWFLLFKGLPLDIRTIKSLSRKKKGGIFTNEGNWLQPTMNLGKPFSTSSGVGEGVVKEEGVEERVAKEEVKDVVEGGGEEGDKEDSKDNNHHRSMETGNNRVRNRVESLIVNNNFSQRGDIQ